MKRPILQLTAICSLAFTLNSSAAVLYVDLNSTNATPPYSGWSTAATNIQDAVDAAVNGDKILVNNGVYRTGGQITASDPNRVAVTKPVTIQSVAGPESTSIDGEGEVRCVYLASGAMLAGFTLTNGLANGSGGGVWCEALSSVVSNCVLVGNTTYGEGGGATGGTLNDCTLTGNYSYYGGGAQACTLNICTLRNNVGSTGGGANNSILNRCILSGNSTYDGEVVGTGGGANGSVLNSCTLYANSSSYSGGGVSGSTLNNCTITENSALYAGGANTSALTNCIVYDNDASWAGSNYLDSVFYFSCATPVPGGLGNTDAEPQLADFSHLAASSPCRSAGVVAQGMGVDIDGEAWATPRSIGCDEYHSGAITGLLSVTIQAAHTNVATGFMVDLSAQISGHASENRWDFGDGTIVSNQLRLSHAWVVAGTYPTTFTVYNESNPDGLSATVMVYVLTQPIHYVALLSTNPVSPYVSWATAATNIQDAVDAAAVAGAVVLVGDGVYQTGGRVAYGAMTNRVVVTKTLTVQSLNGPLLAVIHGNGPVGDGAVRCAYLTNGATLVGFTLTNGATLSSGDWTYERSSGGGVWCASVSEVLSNCVFAHNLASNAGGGAYQGTLNNCTFVGNTAGEGGGAFLSILNDCSFLSNSASFGGGCRQAIARNCTFTNNVASYWGGGAHNSTLDNCTFSKNSAEDGGGAIYGTLNNCMLATNSASYGGGACAATLNYCTLIGNSATYHSGDSYSGYGGGADSCLLNDCSLRSNSAFRYGGGASYSTLNNCTLTGNSASSYGGGAYSGALTNCIVYFNTAPILPNYSICTLNHCCTTPQPTNGLDNITNAPLFVNQAGGDFHLQSNSPCINAGDNAYVTGTNDLDGNPRIKGGTVDIGAYEFQTPTSVISYAWLQQYGLTNNGSADYADADHDGMNNWQEWQAGTVPTNALSVLRLSSPTRNGSGLVVTWQSVSTRAYFIERSINLGVPGSFLTLATNIAGQPGTTSFTDTYALGSGPYFYRVGIWTSAYQVRTAASIIPFTWLQQYSLPTDGSADFVDTDGDGMNNWQEWRTGTVPNDPASLLKMLVPTNSVSSTTITWQSVSGMNYFIQRSSNLGAQPSFSTIQSNIVGQAGTTSYTDTNAVGLGPFFYRVGVQ
ncbi:MAG: choice-of-anchor Q domain-containing protein [Verrucomicrobiota bacterium]|jgi:predicted outer membrane repeat protein